MSYIDDIFGPEGAFSKQFPGYEPRPQQLELARAIDRGITEGKHVLGEGPCGVGKAQAYAVPATYHALQMGTTAVIVTANIALQEQLIKKDLPLLASIAPWKFSYALLKGRNNFVCMDRVYDSETNGVFNRLGNDEVDNQTRAIMDWAAGTQTGDSSELPFVPHSLAWNRFAIGADECVGKDCWVQDKCFSQRLRNKAWDADVVVTNYHMLFLHTMLKRETGMDLLLPPFGILVMDEAHEAADIARTVFGNEVSERAVTNIVRDICKFWHDHEYLLDGACFPHTGAVFNEDWGHTMRDSAGKFFDEVSRHARSTNYDRRLRPPGLAPFIRSIDFILGLENTKRAANLAVAKLSPGIENGSADKDTRKTYGQAKSIFRRTVKALDALAGALELSNPNSICYIENEIHPKIVAKTLDVASILKESLYPSIKAAICVSATMTVGGKFDFVRSELGVPQTQTGWDNVTKESLIEIAVGSPFNFDKQAAFFVPGEDKVPLDPKDKDFFGAAIVEAQAFVEACKGRTLILCTSYADMNKVSGYLKRALAGRYRVLVQGEQSSTELAKLFKADISSVLIGVKTFWTGIDVPGEALTGLIVWKLPFPHPDDPILVALNDRDSRYPNDFLPFILHSIPRAAMLLRQAVGRAVRSKTDICVIACMDRRILDASKGYSQTFIDSLPEFGDLLLDTAGIGPFLEEAEKLKLLP